MAATSSMPTPAPCSRMARRVASTSSWRRARRCSSQRELRPSGVASVAPTPRTVAGTASTCYLPYRVLRPLPQHLTPRSQTGDLHPPRRRPRRQPDPLRPPIRRLRARRPTRTCSPPPSTASSPATAWPASGSARSSPARCSSTAATSTSPARPCSARACRRPPRPTTSQQACGTGLEAAILVANKIALGPDRLRHRRRRRHGVRRPDRRAREAAPQAAAAEPRQDARPTRRWRRWRFRPTDLGVRCPRTPSRAPACRWASTWPSPQARGASPARTRTSSPLASHHNLAAAYERGFFDDLVTPYLGLTRDSNLRPDSTVEKLAHAQAGLRQGRGRDDDGRQLHAADRRRLRRAARLARSGRPSTA